MHRRAGLHERARDITSAKALLFSFSLSVSPSLSPRLCLCLRVCLSLCLCLCLCFQPRPHHYPPLSHHLSKGLVIRYQGLVGGHETLKQHQDGRKQACDKAHEAHENAAAAAAAAALMLCQII